MSRFTREEEVSKQAFKELAPHLHSTALQTPSASDLWERMTATTTSSLVSLVSDEATIQTLPHEEFATMDPVRPAYGLDAGSTGGIQLHSGHRVCRCRSMFGVTEKTGTVWADQTHVSAAIEPFQRSEPYYSSSIADRGYRNATITSHVLALPSPQQARIETQGLVTLLQFLTEGLHLQAGVQRLDGPLYLDGALLPLSPAGRLQVSGGDSPWAELMRLVLTLFATSIGAHLENGHRVFAIAKTQETDALVRTLAGVDTDREPIASGRKLPWHTDRQFISQLFDEATSSAVPDTTWVFTPWLAQPELVMPSGDATHHPLAAISLSYFPPELLSRAYFFVRVPNGNGVFRVEAPLPVIQSADAETRELYQRQVMREMAQCKGTAEGISRADSKVGLDYGARVDLMETLETMFASTGFDVQCIQEHNRDVRWQR